MDRVSSRNYQIEFLNIVITLNELEDISSRARQLYLDKAQRTPTDSITEAVLELLYKKGLLVTEVQK